MIENPIGVFSVIQKTDVIAVMQWILVMVIVVLVTLELSANLQADRENLNTTYLSNVLSKKFRQYKVKCLMSAYMNI
jgi:hypothetical protein